MTAYIRICAGIALFGIIAAPALADITWTQVDTDTSGGETYVTEQTIAVSGRRFAISTDQGMRIVMDVPNDRMLMIDTGEQAYMESSISELDRQAADIQSDTERMLADALKDVPAAQRAQIEAMMRQQMEQVEQATPEPPEQLDYEPTGNTATIAGYAANEYLARDADGSEHRLWCSKDVTVIELEVFYEAIRGIEMFGEMDETAEALSFGFPLKSEVNTTGGNMTTEVTDINYDAVDEAVFAVPEGFTKRAGMFPGGM